MAAIAHFVERQPGHTAHHFVADQLNTHQSEALVRCVAEWCGIDEDPGKKGRHGILQSMASCAEFLSRPDKAIVFHYTPKHASWMNQIEIWFGILAYKVIRRASFCSTTDLRNKLLDFIEYFNANLAQPFRWTCTGEALCQ